MKKISFLSILLSLLYVTMQAQNVTGTITDGFTNKPISGALVTLDKDKTTFTSDSAGKIEIPCAGTPFYLTVHFMGYGDELVKIANCGRSFKVAMSPSSVQLNEVQINGWANTITNQNNQLYQPASIGVLSADDLNRQTGLGLVDAIDMIPGVNMMDRTAFGGDRIMIRGYYGGGSGTGSLPSFNSNGLGYQVNINNIPITDATGATIMDAIDFATLGKVEVIKGPQSTLYGSGIGGVVNLYTARPTPNTTEIAQSAMGGSYGLYRTTTAVTTAGSNYDLSIDYGHQNYNGFRPNDASNKDFVTLTGNYYGNKQTLSTYFSYSRSLEQLAGEQDSAEFYSHSQSIVVPTYITNNSHVAIENFRGGITDEFKFNNHFSNLTTLWTSGYNEDMPYAKGVTDYSALSFGARTGFIYDQQFSTVGVHGILGASFVGTRQTLNGESFGTASNLLEKAWNSSVFTEWKVTLPYKFSIKAGVSANIYKFSYQNYDSTYHVYNADTVKETISAVYFGSPTYRQMFNPAITPSISIDKVFNDKASVYASVSLGYTPPTISEMVVAAPTGTQLDTSLKPERAIQYELGTKGSFINKKLSYQVALFYMDIYNKLVSEQASAGYTYTANAGEQRDLGLEVALSYAIIENHNQPVSLLRPFISYTYSDFTYHNFSDYAQIDAARHLAEVNFSGNHVAGVAPNRFNAGIDFALKYGLYLNVTDQYFDKTPYTFNNQNYVKAYNLLGAKIGYRVLILKHLGIDAFVGANNILGATYYTSLFEGETIYQLGDGAILPAPYKPTFYGGGTISYRF